MHTLISPLKVAVSSKKNWILNLNNYRNTHYQSLNKSKVEYKSAMAPQIQNLPIYPSKIKLTYTLFPGTHRLTDVGNVCSIHDKYFADALTELGKIPDDNYKYMPQVEYLFGEVDKDNPRVEIQIKDLSMKIEKSLKIIISQADVEAAIIRMITDEDPTIEVDSITFTHKRAGNESLSVKVDAHFAGEAPFDVEKASVEPTVPKTKKAKAKPEVEETPVPVPEAVTEVADELETVPAEGTPALSAKTSLFG